MAYGQGRSRATQYKHNDVIKLTWESEKTVCAVVPIENNRAWIATWGADRMVLVDKEGRFIEETDKIQGIIFDAKRYNSDLLVTLKNDRRVMRLSQCERSKTVFHEFESSYTTGLGVVQNRYVPVCLVSGPKNVCGPDDKNAKVVKLNHEGVEIQIIQYDNNGCPLCGWPVSVTSLPTGEVVIVDLGSEECVLFLDRRGERLGTWSSNEAGTRTESYCRFVTSDRFSRVFVTDDNNGVFMLLKNGNDARRICDESMGITSPTAIAVNNKGQLMIGSAGGKIHLINVNDYRLMCD